MDPERAVAAAVAEPSASRGPRVMWWLGLGVLGALAGWLHWRSGYVFPWPWPDESHFIAPALRLASLDGLEVPALNAPEGILWIPSGFYVAQVPLLWTGGSPLAMGRLLALIGVAVFACAMATVAARAGAPRLVCLAAAALWLCQPRVVAAANIARMEGLLLGLMGVAVWLVSTERWPLAVSVSLLAPLVHPVGVVLPVAVCIAGLLRQSRRPWSWWESWALAGVAIAWAVELAHFLRHADEAAAHLRFQVGRKTGRAIVIGPWHRTLLIATAVCGAVATLRWRRAPGPVVAVWVSLALAGGLIVVEVTGQELWYEVLGRETAPALLLLAIVVAVARLRVWPRRARQLAAAVMAAVLLAGTVAGVRETLTQGWYGMRPDARSRGEWQQFVADAVDLLRRVDDAATEPTLVVVDPNSGFGQEVFSRTWQRLNFVQPTPATPMDTTVADFVVTTPGAPSVTAAVAEQWGVQPPLHQVRSAHGSFGLDLFANPASGPL